ncbi:MAG: MmcQ/YjbR family DNA-binding protein [Actinomycetota bacterium]|nr:MmcQ/YjbR family DNA-binding protein [Actinomycetota bacterium]
MITTAVVRRLALSLPETTEKPSYGTPGFRVKDKLFARIREEGDVLVVWVADLDEKAALIAADPEKFFSTPHYDGYETVLVRFDAVDRSELREILTDSWRLRAPKRVLAAHPDL